MNTTPQNTPFKQTEIGPIPQDWEVKKLVDLCIKIQDGTHFSPKIGGSDYLYITSKNIKFGFLDISNADSIGKAQHQNIYKRCDVKFGDLLLTKDGANTGNAAINILNEEFSLLSSVAFLRFDEKYFNSNYFLQQILSFSGQFRIKEAMSGNAITRLTLEKIKKLSFPLPPTKAEQTAIATALSDADALIGSLEKLIHKKRLLKQATMQHLLTPKEDWEVKKLGEIAEIDPENLNSSTKPDYTFQYISLEDVDCGTLRNTTEMQFMNAPSRARRKLRKNDILVSTVRPNLKSHLHIKTEIKDWICSTGFCVLRCNEYYANSSFVFNHFFGSSINSQIDNLITGSNYPAINSRDVKNLEISFPPLAEQTRIATILSDMDAELSGLEGKLEKYRQLKQGMMQQLLTGKIRLVG